ADAAREAEKARRKAESDAELAAKALGSRPGSDPAPMSGELDLSELALVSGKVNDKTPAAPAVPAAAAPVMPPAEAPAATAAKKLGETPASANDSGRPTLEILDDALAGNRRSTSGAGIGARDVAAAISAGSDRKSAAPAPQNGDDGDRPILEIRKKTERTAPKTDAGSEKSDETPSAAIPLPPAASTPAPSKPSSDGHTDAELLSEMKEVHSDSVLPEEIAGDSGASSDTDAAKRRAKNLSLYFFPPTSLLKEPVNPSQEDVAAELRGNAQKIMNKLNAFNVKIAKIDYSRGPTITRYELYPEASTRVRSIASLSDDIALELAATIRMEAPIPNKNAVGVEVPNQVRATVFIRDLIESEKFKSMNSKLSACLGKDVGGNMVFFDIGKMPHLLVAGTTGSGKSVCINTIILSLLFKSRPDEVQFIMIDPKKIEMGMYNGLPHMKVPVVTDMKRAAGTLNAAVNEMEHRYTLFEDCNARDIDGYNKLMSEGDPDFIPLPRLVIIIDELADLMMSSPTEIETAIIRIAQKARAAGIHLIIGTQRPSANVITGLIKANVPSRIAFSVVSNVDSRIIIDVAGAEKLIGKGDMLFSPIGSPKPARIQGAFVADDEVRAVTDFIKANSEKVEYDEEFIASIDRETDRLTEDDEGKHKSGDDSEISEFSQDADKLFNQALHIAVENGSIATSLLQRKLSIGFGRGAKIIDRMEALGFVSGANGTKPRNVLIDKQQLMELEMSHDPRVEGRFN
ncbi:MAG: DNA translocase FtsK, partial [Clostridia bacterium]|nr:DNA translocase FtsK [Clostridia bacterium]